MKFICTADLHLSAYTNDPVINGVPEKLHYTLLVINNIILYAKKQKIFNIVIAGDIFHTKNIIHSLAQSELLDLIRSNKDITFYCINGNHDLSSRSGQGVSALKCLDNENNVRMFHNTTLIENIYFVPWDPDNMINDIKSGPTNSFLVAHLGVNEAKLSSGISIMSDIKLSDFKKYSHCFLGHYHKPQNVGNVTYIGSPIQMDWGEKNEEKRFIIVDSETGKIKSVPTDGYRKYYEFDLTKDNRDNLLKECETLQKGGHYIKLNKIEEFDTNEIDDKFRVVTKIDKDITNRGITSSMSTDEKISRYLEIKNIPENDRDIFKKEGINIINQCENKKIRG